MAMLLRLKRSEEGYSGIELMLVGGNMELLAAMSVLQMNASRPGLKP